MFICLKNLGVVVSMVVMGGASDVMVYDRITPELSNALLHMKQGTTSIKK